MPNLRKRIFERDDSFCGVSIADPPTITAPTHFAMFAGVPESMENMKHGNYEYFCDG